ncbi:MAG TPA: TonB-dependent receptor [Sphingomicrobium sp.]|jgi:outer membrane receptor protein involved in Fe transport|nr:TonB-dependent receptor [Sphingomicrobium sp.]
MKKISLLGTTSLRTFATVGLVFGIAGVANAQETPAETPTPDSQQTAGEDAPETLGSEVEAQSGENANTSDEIVVTGSRIRRPNLESTVPVTSIGGETLFQQGDANIGDTLNELPQLRSTFAQQNPGLGIGIAGLNLLDLRGLGTQRTLVLVNGRRHVAADILNNAVSPDVNSIPNDLIERIDIVTGGNSAIYGSDAIAGVVNFVLRRDFEGLQIRGQAGVSPRGFGGNQYVSAMYGKNLADDRANITVHGEFANQERVFGSSLPWLRSVNGQINTDVDPAGLPNGSDGVADFTFNRDVRSATNNRFGLIPITQSAATPACGTGIAASNGPPSTVGGSPYNCNFLFDPAGNLAAQTGTRVGAGPFGSFLGGNGQTGREGRLFSVQPEVQRYNLNLLAHFTINDAIEPFVEAKWNRVNALGNNAGPSFIQGTFGQFDARERVRLDNPFLDLSERTTIANAILASGCNTDLSTACGTRASVFGTGLGRSGALNAVDRAAIANGTYRFVVARNLLDAGIRDEENQRDTYRIVGGLRGDFNDDWNYEVSLNYGKFKEKKTTFGYLDRQRFMLALDAGVNPLTGQIQCRSQFDPAAAAAFDRGQYQVNAPTATNPNPSRGNAGQVGRLAADIAACQPYNPFGGSDNSAAVDYFSYNSRTTGSLRQFVATGFVGGDSSQLFELPGGPVRFALGAEYRREQGDYTDDPFTNEGNPLATDPSSVNPVTQTNTNAVVIGRFNPDTFKVQEAFGELQIPIVKEIPLFHELTLSGAARVSKYNKVAGDVGTVWTYNVGADWAPVRDIRFRGNYSKAVRAPNLSELYFPPVPNFAPGFVDPCSSNVIANNPNRSSNCQADLGPLLASIRNSAISLPVISGSNPLLGEETSRSITLGAVVQPRWVPGLSLSVDYYKIKVEDVIVSLTAQAIANNCYDQPSLSNVFCSLFDRNRGTGPDGFGQNPGEILGNTLIQAGVNFAARRREGVDVNVAYRGDLGNLAKINTNFIYTHNIKNSNYENPALPKFENRILSELGDPRDEFRWDTDLTRGAFTFGYRMRYIGPMLTSLYENFYELDTACSTTTCPPNNLDAAEPRKYDAVFYHDIRFEVDLKDTAGFGKQFSFYAGVDNLLDTHPPLGLSGTGTTGITDRGTGNAAIYDAFGRKAYAGFRARF